MPFPMVHLCIADEMLRRGFEADDPAQFFLGAVAPDSVHFREGYDPAMKEISHLWVGSGPRWGVTLDSGRWYQNTKTFWQTHRGDAQRDFIAGYCTHVFTDWLNDARIWKPFRLKNEGCMDAYGADRYHEEALMTDYALYLKSPRRGGIFEGLAKAHGCDLAGLVFSEDIARMQNSLLHEQFVDRTAGKPEDFIYCTLQMVEALIGEASRKIPGYLAE